MKQLYGRVFTAVLFMMAVVFTPAIAEASCQIFEHRDYGGASLTLFDNDRVIMAQGESIGMTTNGHGGSYRIRYRPAWNDHVSSFRVTDGCTITLWEHINQEGARWRTYKSYKFVGDNWNDEVSEVFCSCPN
jgi:syncollin